jgi:hypothetical protein
VPLGAQARLQVVENGHVDRLKGATGAGRRR